MGTKRSRCPPGVCVRTWAVTVAGRGGNKGKGRSRRHSSTSCLPAQARESPPSPAVPGCRAAETLLRKSGSNPHAVLIATVAIMALKSPSQVHHQPVAAGPQLQPLRLVSRWLGGQASHFTCRRLTCGPPEGAVPDTLKENTHACPLLLGSPLRTALRCTNTGGLR